MFPLLIRELVKLTKLPSQMTKVDFPKKILKRWSVKLRNTRTKMKRPRRRLNPRIPLKTIASK